MQATTRRYNYWGFPITWPGGLRKRSRRSKRCRRWFPSANVDAAYILGICYIQTKDYPHARTAFAKMFGVPADSAASYLFTARMLLRQDFGPVAEEYAQKAATLDPKLPLAHFLLGELNLYHSKIPEAIAEFQKELDLNPGYAGGVLQTCRRILAHAEI